MIHVVVPVYPDKANQTQHPRPEGSNLVDEIDIVISPFPRRKQSTTILLLAKVIMCVVARDCMEGVIGAEPFIKAASWWHAFQVRLLSQPPMMSMSNWVWKAWRL